MTGDTNSLVDRTGDVIGDGTLSRALLVILGFVIGQAEGVLKRPPGSIPTALFLVWVERDRKFR